MAADSVASKWIPDVTERWRQIESEIDSEGTYTHTQRVAVWIKAWLGATATDALAGIFGAPFKSSTPGSATPRRTPTHLANHVNDAFNGGKIANVITVFPQEAQTSQDAWRMVNHQLVRYAGFRRQRRPSGRPGQRGLHRLLRIFGMARRANAMDRHCRGSWSRTESPCRPVDPFQSGDLTLHEVPIIHPDFPATAELDLRWYAVPLLADMALKIGGVVYPFAPFNGHYLGTEIAARNLTDPDRYNVLEPWAKACGIQPSTQRSLWKDEALVKLNQALLSSFDHAGITMGDHHELGTGL